MSPSQENYRTAEIHILEGDAAGCCECAPRDWTGAAFRIPRTLLERNKDGTRQRLEKACDELKGGGIYFLFGRTKVEGGESKKCVYVGKGGHYEDSRGEETGVLRRVMQRHRGSIEKDWDEVVVVVSDNKEKRPLDIDALEKKFIDRISETLDTAEWVLRNENRPRPVRKPNREIDRFVEFTNVALRAFGYCVLENLNRKPHVDPIPAPELPNPSTPHKDGLLLSLSYTPKALGKTFIASGKYISDNEFVVLEGSEFCPVEIPCCRGKVKRVRRDHADKIKNGKLTSDVQFENPSIAAGFVCGSPMDGYRNWRDPNPKSKKTLGEILAESKKD